MDTPEPPREHSFLHGLPPGEQQKVVACADLVERAGGKSFTVGFLHDGVPLEEAGWWAQAQYRGAELTADQHRSPGAACHALAMRILEGGTCRCGRKATAVGDPTPALSQCLWRLVGPRWEPSCTDAPVDVPAGARGDLSVLNRAMRRRAMKRHGDGRTGR